jgi:hypothetical protein
MILLGANLALFTEHLPIRTLKSAANRCYPEPHRELMTSAAVAVSATNEAGQRVRQTAVFMVGTIIWRMKWEPMPLLPPVPRGAPAKPPPTSS